MISTLKNVLQTWYCTFTIYIHILEKMNPINLCSFEKVYRVVLILKNVVFINVLQFYKLFTLYLFIEILNNDNLHTYFRENESVQ